MVCEVCGGKNHNALAHRPVAPVRHWPWSNVLIVVGILLAFALLALVLG
jgi:hypothetical protein